MAIVQYSKLYSSRGYCFASSPYSALFIIFGDLASGLRGRSSHELGVGDNGSSEIAGYIYGCSDDNQI